MTSHVPVLLLTWNPGPGDDRRWTPLAWAATMVAPHRAGEVVETSWGVGRHVNGIDPGHGAYLYRQGEHGRGLVARGVLLSGPRPDPERTRNIVDVQWRASLPVEDALEVDELERAAPEFAWRQVWSSGRRLPAPVAEAVDGAWVERLADVERLAGVERHRVARQDRARGL